MSWKVIIEDENGNAIKVMQDEFHLSDYDMLKNKKFIILKYLDLYGDTTFNILMFNDLIQDLVELTKMLPIDNSKIKLVISYAKECVDKSHTYLKFYGD